MALSIIIVNTLAQGAQLSSCHQVLDQNRHLFNFEDPRLKVRHNEPYFLGEGAWGKVWLMGDSKVGWHVDKTYRDPQQLEKDRRALKFLGAKFHHPHFRVIDSKSKNNTTLSLPYSIGRTLEDVYLDTTTSKLIRDRIRDSYVELLRAMLKFFEHEEFLIDIRRSELPRVSAQNDAYAMGGYHFIIKPDNIILDPVSLEMTLIDPF